MGRFSFPVAVTGATAVDAVVILGTPGSDLAGAVLQAITSHATMNPARGLAQIDLTGGSDDQRWFCNMVFAEGVAPLAAPRVDTFYGSEATEIQASLNAALAAVPDANTIRLMGFSGAGQGHPCVGLIISST